MRKKNSIKGLGLVIPPDILCEKNRKKIQLWVTDNPVLQQYRQNLFNPLFQYSKFSLEFVTSPCICYIILRYIFDCAVEIAIYGPGHCQKWICDDVIRNGNMAAKARHITQSPFQALFGRVVQCTQTDPNGIVLNPLVFHWWNASHYGEYFRRLQAK